MNLRKHGDFKLMETNRGTTYVRLPLIAFSAILIMLVGLAITVWSIKREPETYLQVKNAGDLHSLIPSIVGVTQGNLEQGNKVEVLQNGDGFFPLLMRDIEA